MKKNYVCLVDTKYLYHIYTTSAQRIRCYKCTHVWYLLGAILNKLFVLIAAIIATFFMTMIIRQLFSYHIWCALFS